MSATEVRIRRGTAAEIAAFTGAEGELTYATDTKALYVHDGSTAGGTLVGGFAAATKALFVQTNAPTGWTKDTDQNDKALRIVSGTPGTGGATAFSSVFGSGKTTGSHVLTESELASHLHSSRAVGGSTSGGKNTGTVAGNTGSTGGDTGHDHTLSLDLQYVDVIKATKD